MLRDASVRFLSDAVETTSVVPFNSSVEMTPTNSFVFGELNFKSSTTTTSPALSRSLNALRNASDGDFADIFCAGGATALRRPIGGDGVMHGLRAFAVLDQRELHFQFALVFSCDIFNGNFHGLNYFLASAGLASAFF